MALLVCIIAVAAVMRIYHIENPGLWSDEGNNAYFSQQSFPDLVRMCRLTHDTDPPAHRLALKLWLALVGHGALEMRSLSVACNLLTIGVVWWWGTRLAGPKAGLVAALFFALSPMAIYHGREAKGYPFVTLFCTIECAIWANALRSNRPPRAFAWAGASLCAAIALGAHYYVALSFAAQGAALFGCWLVRSRSDPDTATRHILVAWLASMLVACVMVAPWVWLTYGPAKEAALSLRPERELWSLWQCLAETILGLAGGTVPRDLYRLPAALGLGALSLAALWRSRDKAWWPLILVAVPIALAAALQLLIPFFSERFLYYTLAPLSVLAGLAWVAIGSVKWPLVGMVAMGWALCMPGAYAPHGHLDQDLRPIADSLRKLSGPSDTIVVGYIWQEGILRQYAPDLDVAYALGWYSAETVADEVGPLLDQNNRLWLLSYRVSKQQQSNLPGRWLTENAAHAWGVRHQGHTLDLFMSACAKGEQGLPISWGQISAKAWAPQGRTVRRGSWITVPITWHVDVVPRQPTVAFVHLSNTDGQVIAQRDGAPRNGIRLFRAMAPGQSVEECRALHIPTGVEAGAYHVLLGLYYPQSGERLTPLADDPDGDGAVMIGSVVVDAD